MALLEDSWLTMEGYLKVVSSLIATATVRNHNKVCTITLLEDLWLTNSISKSDNELINGLDN